MWAPEYGFIGNIARLPPWKETEGVRHLLAVPGGQLKEKIALRFRIVVAHPAERLRDAEKRGFIQRRRK